MIIIHCPFLVWYEKLVSFGFADYASNASNFTRFLTVPLSRNTALILTQVLLKVARRSNQGASQEVEEDGP